MDEKQLSVSAFADEIGVKRPTMTHTMTGRNNPSLDIVSKILERYQDINSDWLLFGKGGMYKGAQALQPGLFDDFESKEVIGRKAEDVEAVRDDSVKSSPVSSILIDDDRYSKKSKETHKKVAKIMVFYSDNTFEIFLPEENLRK
jgi:Helix-turn-helix.